MVNNFEVSEHGGIDPQKESPRLVAEHLSAYHFARQFSNGRLLEVGFGDGYGSSFLAESAREVKAIDLFDRNVTAAAAKYLKPNLQFMKMNATDLQWPDDTFDLTCSFQVIEHIPQALMASYVAEIKRVTKRDGVVCLSTLNLKKNQKPGKPYLKSPHHDKEFTAKDLTDLLNPFFRQVTLYGLYPNLKHAFFERLKKAGLFNFLPKSMDPASCYFRNITVNDFQWLKKSTVDDSIDLMAVCYQ